MGEVAPAAVSRREWASLTDFVSKAGEKQNDRGAWHPSVTSPLPCLDFTNSRFVIAGTVALATLTILAVAQPPFACHKRKSVIDPAVQIERVSFTRILAWTTMAFATVWFAKFIVPVHDVDI